jgi:hypothetical protein
MSSHRLNPRVVATVLAALCLAVCVAPNAFARRDAGNTLAGHRFATPDRAVPSSGGSVGGLGLIPDPHATVKPDAALGGPKASRDSGDNLAAGLAAAAIVLVLVAPFALTARVRRVAPV